MIGTPILMMVYPAHTAIQINIILSIVLSGLMIYNIRKEVDTKLLKRLIVGSFPGIILGIFVYLYMDIDWLKFFVGLIILIVTVSSSHSHEKRLIVTVSSSHSHAN